MSRPKRLPVEIADDNFRREIRVRQAYLNEMSQRQLSERVGISQSTISRRTAHPEQITVAELRKLVAGIEPDPRVILQLVGYDLKRMGI